MIDMYWSAVAILKNRPEATVEVTMLVHPVPHPSAHAAFYRGLKRKHKAQFADAPELYWVMIGKTDFFYPRMIAYHRYLIRNGYPHEYLTTPGGHQWYNWEEYCNLFMQRLWK